jgi:hypothetical protein
MKNRIFLTILVVAINFEVSLAQVPDWSTGGNGINGTEWFGADNTSDIPVSFEHRANDDASSFLWSTTTGTSLFPRMILTRPGWLGLNTTTPQMRFHVEDGGILSTGVQGTNTVTGAGTRLMWIPDMAAFRAGRVGIDGTTIGFWDAANVGVGSAAFGTDNRAAGEDSFAQGNLNNVNGECSVAFGGGNVITNDLGFAMGRLNNILNQQSISLGFRNIINEEQSILIGTQLRSNAFGSITLGFGVDGNNFLTNAVANSLMVGFNSTVPTLFVGTSSGVGTFGNVGIGNITAPTEVLDVNGTARLRVVPTGVPDVLITGVEEDGLGDYQLNHLEFSQNPNTFLNGQGDWAVGTNVCDWNISGQNLTMGWLGSPDACHTGFVGIGRNSPDHKLDVLVGTPNAIGGDGYTHATRNVINTNGQFNTGVSGVAAQLTQSTNVRVNRGGSFTAAHANATSGVNIGVYTVANDEGPGENWDQSLWSYGLFSLAGRATNVLGVSSRARHGTKWNIGVFGWATEPSAGGYNIGIYGRAEGNSGTAYNVGVYGEAAGAPTNYAGYFAGQVVDMQQPLNPSDEMLKENIQDYSEGLNIINQLSPKNYNYKLEEYPFLGLPEGSQIGLLAQDVMEIIPGLTQTVVSPPKFDTLGVEIVPSVEFTAMSYTGLVPILISAVKEQQSQITTQNESIVQLQESLNNQNEVLAQMMEQLAAMQQQINQCCNAYDGTKSMPGSPANPQDLNNQKSNEGGNELYQNIPNPFRESTTISYQLETGGRVQLSIYDGNGKVVTTLVEANQPNGRHSAVWNANGMPAGVYHYALYVDGELLVKRAIKLQE